MKNNKWLYYKELQGNYGQGWECLTAGNYKECRVDLAAYRANEGGRYRIVSKRELNPNYKKAE